MPKKLRKIWFRKTRVVKNFQYEQS